MHDAVRSPCGHDQSMIAGEPYAFGPSCIEDLDRHLVAFGRREAAMRLRVGELLTALGEGYRELGLSGFGAYVRERLSRSVGWAKDSRVVARRALERPVLREAFLAGRISWSVLELLLRHTEADDGGASADAELLDAVAGLTVRELRQALRTRAEGGDVELDEDDARRPHVLHLTMPREDALALAEAEALVRHMDGTGPSGAGLDDIWVEPLLAEGMSTLFEFLPLDDRRLSPVVAEAFARRRQRLAEGEVRREREEVRAERMLGFGRATADGLPLEALFSSELPLGARAIDAELRAMCRELCLADLAFGALALRF